MLAWLKNFRDDCIANDAWFGFDKLIHAAFGAWIWLLGRVLVGPAFFQRVVLAVAVSAGFECWQLARYLHWQNHGAQAPRPDEADLFSYKDIAWGLAGAATVVLALIRLHVAP